MYLIFGGDTYYARGGGNDFLEQSESLEKAKEIAKSYIGTRLTLEHLRIDIDWSHVFDVEARTILERYGTRPYGDDPEDVPEADRV